MLFFRRILNFKRDYLSRLRDKRKARRYPVGPGFPLKAVINLIGTDDADEANKYELGDGRNWAGRLVDFSSTGVSLQVLPAAMTARGERTRLHLTLEQHELEIPCTVAHFRTYREYAVCGLSLQFPDINTQKAYLQLLESVVMGATFAPLRFTGRLRNPPGLDREQYQSDSDARLFAWRDKRTGNVDSFELYVADHCVRGDAISLERRQTAWGRPGSNVRHEQPFADVYTRQKTANATKVALADPAFVPSAGLHYEVRQLFRWVVPNLAKQVSLDVRRFMEKFVQ
ncbi:MAG: PilZ domain-containing protein [Opitutae bacterium]|nr:PilZ domain-containing protein [Opitutae bacterium]